jgi:hypothetical protein
MYKNTILLSLIFALSSCGKSKSTPYVDGAITLSEKNTFEQIIKTTSISPDAPEGLGFLISRIGDKNQSIGACSSFFIDSETVVTNSHCIPDLLKKDEAALKDCGNYIRVITQTNKGIEKTHCKKILFFSKINEDTLDTQPKDLPDYAIFKIDRQLNFSQTFSLSSKGIENHEVYLINAFNPVWSNDSTNIFGEFEQKRCISKLDNALLKTLSVNISRIVTLFQSTENNTSCNIVKGNSGSPITPLNNNHEKINYSVPAIAYALVEEGHFERKTRSGKLKNTPYNRFIYASNFACIAMPQGFNSPTLHHQCDQLEALEKEKLFNHEQITKSPAFVSQVDADLQILRSDLPNIFSYAPAKSISQYGILSHLEPTCFRSIETWTEEEKKLFLNQDLATYISSPELIHIVSYNHFLEFYPRRVENDEIESYFVKYFFHIKSNNISKLTITNASTNPEEDKEITVCK